VSDGLADPRPPQDEGELAAFVARHLGHDLAAFPESRRTRLRGDLEGVELRPSPEVLEVVVGHLCVGETWFERDRHQLRELRRLLETGSRARPFRAWSAGCASGEEAYSLAALARDVGFHDVEVLGTDLRAPLLERARAGRYPFWSMRTDGARTIPEWIAVEGLDLVVEEALRRRVRFAPGNLLTDPFPRALDLVVCRNVLLYFTAEGAARVLAGFADALRPGGILVLAPGDPRPSPGVWERIPEGPAGIFRRVSTERAPGSGPAAMEGLRWGGGRPPASPVPHPVPTARVGPPRSSSAPRAEGVGPSGAVAEPVRRAQDLAARGRIGEALEVLDGRTVGGDAAVERHLVGAMIAEEAGRVEEALRRARRACFDAMEAVVPNYVMGTLLDRHGEARDAGRYLRRARRALARVEDLAAPLPHGLGLTGAQVDRVLARWMDRDG